MATLLVVRILQDITDFHSDLTEHMRDHDEMVAPLPFFAVIN
jgi:hypothetical protein